MAAAQFTGAAANLGKKERKKREKERERKREGEGEEEREGGSVVNVAGGGGA